jgi:hypothetical protein
MINDAGKHGVKNLHGPGQGVARGQQIRQPSKQGAGSGNIAPIPPETEN